MGYVLKHFHTQHTAHEEHVYNFSPKVSDILSGFSWCFPNPSQIYHCVNTLEWTFLSCAFPWLHCCVQMFLQDTPCLHAHWKKIRCKWPKTASFEDFASSAITRLSIWARYAIKTSSGFSLWSSSPTVFRRNLQLLQLVQDDRWNPVVTSAFTKQRKCSLISGSPCNATVPHDAGELLLVTNVRCAVQDNKYRNIWTLLHYWLLIPESCHWKSVSSHSVWVFPSYENVFVFFVFNIFHYLVWRGRWWYLGDV